MRLRAAFAFPTRRTRTRRARRTPLRTRASKAAPWIAAGTNAATCSHTCTRQHPYRGSFDEYSGTRSGKGEPLGNSGICQRVTIPRNGVLTVALYQLSNEPDTLYAYQEGDLLDGRGRVVVNLFKAVNNDAGWVQGRWNLAAYAGRTVWLYFGVHGDGSPHASTQQFVDEVSLAPNRE